ncbi:hypothetical protein TNIN_371581 [Trichonephila inaurata madagascariensis]|uniref:Uncharacterized protein n=1 Tax=Trichonephila inaurata madagascariensis TaxID=2747483 RepID=A0A8X7BWY8_9ARAC|nr:hypothetical protein TNIN_371581 [Trichonephila inaurata madagascariensis]
MGQSYLSVDKKSIIRKNYLKEIEIEKESEKSQTQPDKTDLVDQCVHIVSFETKDISDIQKDIVIDVTPSSLLFNKENINDNDCEVNPPSPNQQIKKSNHYSSFRNNLKKTIQDLRSSKINNYQNLPKSLDFCDQSKDMLRISTKPVSFANALKHSNEKKSGWIYKNDVKLLLQKKGLLRRSKT